MGGMTHGQGFSAEMSMCLLALLHQKESNYNIRQFRPFTMWGPKSIMSMATNSDHENVVFLLQLEIFNTVYTKSIKMKWLISSEVH